MSVPPIPMSRAMMQGLKAEKEEEIRQAHIKKIVNEIYRQAFQIAQTTTETSYNHEIPSTDMARYTPDQRREQKKRYLDNLVTYRGGNRTIPYYQGPPDPFHIKNMPDILTGLRDLFPGCSVSHTLLCQAKDGKLYDVATLDEAVLPFVDRALDQSYIVIDWS
jgi:hypothetical protein